MLRSLPGALVPHVGVEPTPRRLRVWDASITPMRQAARFADFSQVEGQPTDFGQTSTDSVLHL